jgi:hypothetical protein
MSSTNKIVAKLPLENLWNEKEQLAAVRGRTLTQQEIKLLVDAKPIQFVVADIGAFLRWISIEGRFSFWRAKQNHI